MPKDRKYGGRTKGTPNKATAAAREAIAAFVDGNAHRLQGWLEAIAESEGPQAAWDCMVSVLEYHVPKLQRTDINANIEGKVEALVRVLFVTPPGDPPK